MLLVATLLLAVGISIGAFFAAYQARLLKTPILHLTHQQMEELRGGMESGEWVYFIECYHDALAGRRPAYMTVGEVIETFDASGAHRHIL